MENTNYWNITPTDDKWIDTTDPSNTILTVAHNSSDEWDVYTESILTSWHVIEEKRKVLLKKEAKYESKEWWFVPRSITKKSTFVPSKIKRTIRNTLPCKIRID